MLIYQIITLTSWHKTKAFCFTKSFQIKCSIKCSVCHCVLSFCYTHNLNILQIIYQCFYLCVSFTANLLHDEGVTAIAEAMRVNRAITSLQWENTHHLNNIHSWNHQHKTHIFIHLEMNLQRDELMRTLKMTLGQVMKSSRSGCDVVNVRMWDHAIYHTDVMWRLIYSCVCVCVFQSPVELHKGWSR